MKNEICVDAIVMLEGENGGFHSYMPLNQAMEIQMNGGLENTESLTLRETPDRPIPRTMKEGEAGIVDVWIKMEASKTYYVN